jgi:spore germination protein GerM
MKRILVIISLVVIVVCSAIILVEANSTKNDSMIVKVFFNNNKMDPEFSCNKVFPVERTVLKTDEPEREALVELLSGPAQSETMEGFFTSINSGVKIKNITINNGTISVEFDERLERGVGGSCWVSAIRAQITQTLKQFSNINNVIISIDGRTEDILQP